MQKTIFLIAALLIFEVGTGPAQASPAEATAAAAEKTTAPEKLSVTQHSMLINGAAFDYTATAGRLRVVNSSGKHEADIFFIAYTKQFEQSLSKRPITFAFNGGPGASAVWLNFGAFGPRRVALSLTGRPSGPPYRLADNVYTLLDLTDLVFIDPVGTGFSRPAEDVKADTFYGIDYDVDSLAEFIRLYVTRFSRWDSPRFLAGESYGGLRAVLLADHLHDACGMDFNGLILISPALQFQNFVFAPGNSAPYMMFLPTYTATAFYHKKLASPLAANLEETLADVEAWSMQAYLLALTRGNALSEADRQNTVEKLAAYTGLSEDYIREKKLKVTSREFSRELLRSQGLVVGTLDSRLTAVAESLQRFSDEPDMVLTIGPYVAALSNHLRLDLKYESDLPYLFFSTEANSSWKWGSAIQGYPAVTSTLTDLINKFKYFKVFIAKGYYDLDIGYFATKYEVAHLGLPPDLRANISLRFYDAGHQIYVDEPALKKLNADVAEFIRAVVGVGE
jgi:carboxypeptidase C (cathepsin A)